MIHDPQVIEAAWGFAVLFAFPASTAFMVVVLHHWFTA